MRIGQILAFFSYDDFHTYYLLSRKELHCEEGCSLEEGLIPMLQRRRLHEDVVEALALEIIRGTIPLGGTLPADAALVERFGVSRTVVREALQSLSDRGFVDIRHGSGTYVTGPERWRLLDPSVVRLLEHSGTFVLFAHDIVDARRMFESEAAALAAERATAEEVEQLRGILDQMKSYEADAERYVELDVAFHTKIIEACHNIIMRGIRDQIGSLLVTMMRIRQASTQGPDRRQSTAMHGLIFRGIEEKNPERARAAMLAHLQETERFFKTVRRGEVGRD
jgi:DNA-binding FadR family transcriptional regulator